MGLRHLFRSKKSRALDRAKLSMQKHEIDYVTDLAKKYLRETEGLPPRGRKLVMNSSLRRLCKYVIKVRP